MPALAAGYFAGLPPNGLAALAGVMALWTLVVGRYLELWLRRLAGTVDRIREEGGSGRMPERPGEPAGVIANALNQLLDKAEEANTSLARQKAFFEAIFRHLPGALIVADAQGRIVMANPAVEPTFGYTPEELTEQPPAAWFAEVPQPLGAGSEPFGVPMDPGDGPNIVFMRHKQGGASRPSWPLHAP